MKLTHILSITLAAYAGVSHAELKEIWTVDSSREGGYVSREGGYFDADKDYVDGDGLLCWAASASNMIAWWNKQNPQAAAAAAVSGAPIEHEDIWQTYQDTFTNGGGDRYCGIDWWYEGEDSYTMKWLPAKKQSASSSGGYYADLISDPIGFGYNDLWQEVVDDMNGYSGIGSLSWTIMDLLQSGHVVGLGLSFLTMAEGEYVLNAETGHAITLWGIEYDDEKDMITKMWVTDSDDRQESYWAENEKDLFMITCQGITVGDGAGGTLTTCTFYSEDVLPYGYQPRSFYELNSAVITSITYLSNSVGNFDIPEVPEPATGGLALLGLAGLSARRRRK